MISLEKIQTVPVADNPINRALLDLYQGVWGDYLELRNNDRLSKIYLMAVPDEYYLSDFRVMFLGKETLGWGGEFDLDEFKSYYGEWPGPVPLMRLYDQFVNVEHGDPGSPFHCFVNRFRWNSLSQKPIPVILNNVVKIGKKDRNGFYANARDFTLRHHFLRKEIDILKPQVVICFVNGCGDGNVYTDMMDEMLGKSSVVDSRPIPDAKFTVERVTYDNVPGVQFVHCFHPQGKSKESLGFVSDYVSRLLEFLDKGL